jgi:hypothetical protein
MRSKCRKMGRKYDDEYESSEEYGLVQPMYYPPVVAPPPPPPPPHPHQHPHHTKNSNFFVRKRYLQKNITENLENTVSLSFYLSKVFFIDGMF